MPHAGQDQGENGKQRHRRSRAVDVGLRYEDLALVPVLMASARRLCVNPEAIYYYHRRNDSITRSVDIAKELDIFSSIDLVASRLDDHSRDRIVRSSLEKVLVFGFIPSVTSRYDATTSRSFAVKVRDYLVSWHSRPQQERGGSRGLRGIAIALFIKFPVGMRWVITFLYHSAKLVR